MAGTEFMTPCPWAMWTVWSTEVADLMKRNITREEFSNSVVDIVRDIDELFDNYVFSRRPEKSEIFVIQPVKVKVREGSVEIVGIVYKPGVQSTGGKRWTLIAENELADVFEADKIFISSNGVKNLLIILGGSVLESSQQIHLNKARKNPSKIIRFIDNGSEKPDMEGENIQSFTNPYDEAKKNVEIINVIKRRLKSRPNTTLLKSFPRTQRLRHSPRQKTPNTPKALSRVINISSESNQSPAKEQTTHNGISSSPSDIEICSPPKTNEVVPFVPRRSPLVNSKENSTLPGDFILEPNSESQTSLLHNGTPQSNNCPAPKRRRIDFDEHDNTSATNGYAEPMEISQNVDSEDSQEYSVQQSVLFLRLGFPKKLKNINENLEHFHLFAKIYNVVETDADTLIVRISDGTQTSINIKTLIPPEFDIPSGRCETSHFVDLAILNISKRPDIRSRLMGGLGTTKSFVFTFVSTNKTKSNELELRVDASEVHARWYEVDN